MKAAEERVNLFDAADLRARFSVLTIPPCPPEVINTNSRSPSRKQVACSCQCWSGSGSPASSFAVKWRLI